MGLRSMFRRMLHRPSSSVRQSFDGVGPPGMELTPTLAPPQGDALESTRSVRPEREQKLAKMLRDELGKDQQQEGVPRSMSKAARVLGYDRFDHVVRHALDSEKQADFGWGERTKNHVGGLDVHQDSHGKQLIDLGWRDPKSVSGFAKHFRRGLDVRTGRFDALVGLSGSAKGRAEFAKEQRAYEVLGGKPGIVDVPQRISAETDQEVLLNQTLYQGDLANLGGKITDPDARIQLAIDALTGLESMHDEGWIHKDLKPANILVDEHGRAALTDFGFASDSNLEWGGTADFMHPQLAADRLGSDNDDAYPSIARGKQYDVFGMGSALSSAFGHKTMRTHRDQNNRFRTGFENLNFDAQAEGESGSEMSLNGLRTRIEMYYADEARTRPNVGTDKESLDDILFAMRNPDADQIDPVGNYLVRLRALQQRRTG